MRYLLYAICFSIFGHPATNTWKLTEQNGDYTGSGRNETEEGWITVYVISSAKITYKDEKQTDVFSQTQLAEYYTGALINNFEREDVERVELATLDGVFTKEWETAGKFGRTEKW